ncbi:low affinity immunoglobulin epsilon Fc receptor-like [Mizuhopecten yessoensis]|uniref:low affinity immunoglobulin epsilon Fc receptor-like n=1 Tax=Mizuhopecten yessoensis TaxID=6573 RepID=UPI000B458A6F|nr:low affinity immunoglobulin epsilon Fc receptor-like [Mizuhopecten yessoensis]
MKPYWMLTGLVLQYIVAVTGENKFDPNNEIGLTDRILFLLNGTFYDLKDNVCALQSKVDVLESTVNRSDSLSRKFSNETVITEIRQMVTRELHAFRKIQDGFENAIRLLQKEQADIRILVSSTCRQGHDNSTKDKELEVCEDGWLTTSTKCYYVSLDSEKTNWESAVTHCVGIDSRLVELRNAEEASNLLQLMPERVALRDYVYTGEMRTDDGVWAYLSDSEPVDDTARTWAPDEPGGSPQDCGCVSKEDAFKLTDCHCTNFELHFICEKSR